MSRIRMTRDKTAATSSTNFSAWTILSSHARTSERSGEYGEVTGSCLDIQLLDDSARHGFKVARTFLPSSRGCHRGRCRAPARSIPSTMRASCAASIVLEVSGPSRSNAGR